MSTGKDTETDLDKLDYLAREARQSLETILNADTANVSPEIIYHLHRNSNVCMNASEVYGQGWIGGETVKKRRKKKASELAVDKVVLEEAEKLAQTIKRHPQYKSISFQCIADYDKCCAHRGEKSVLCAFAFIVCFARCLIPFVK
jgi:hypothetical protein